MKHVSILVPDGQCNLSSIVGSFKILTKANLYNVRHGKEPVFTIQLVGNSKTTEIYDGLFTIKPHINYKAVKKTDLIIIPAIDNSNLETSLKRNEVFLPWISQQYRQGAEVASICTGAYLLASTGLLENKSCSTHWNEVERFRKLFPRVNMTPDKTITDEHGIYTNGGAFSFLHLLMYLVEKYYGRDIAILCSKMFEVDLDRHSQSPFTIFSGLKDHQDEEIKKAQIFIENNVGEKISIEELASKLAIGRRHFDRRFIKATASTPMEYLQKVKIEAAKKTLETSRKTIQEVMYSVGYSDLKAFREIFRRITGLTPIEYRQKYNKESVALYYT